MKIIFTKFDKKSINSLPRILFPGKIVLIDKAEDTEEAVNFLLSQPILGAQAEVHDRGSRLPSGKRPERHVQACTCHQRASDWRVVQGAVWQAVLIR